MDSTSKSSLTIIFIISLFQFGCSAELVRDRNSIAATQINIESCMAFSNTIIYPFSENVKQFNDVGQLRNYAKQRKDAFSVFLSDMYVRQNSSNFKRSSLPEPFDSKAFQVMATKIQGYESSQCGVGVFAFFSESLYFGLGGEQGLLIKKIMREENVDSAAARLKLMHMIIKDE